MIEFNNKIKLIISDVDQTIADVYTDASDEIIFELEKLLQEGRILFLISGQDVKDIFNRVVSKIKKELRNKILIGSCSGVEVWGFNSEGGLNLKPFYSLYEEKLSVEQKNKLRIICDNLISEFKLKIFPPGNVNKFIQESEGNPLAIMYQDRGPQITFEFINAYDMTSEQAEKLETQIPETHGSYDLRIPFAQTANEILEKENVPMTARLAGGFAVDIAVKGVSKTTAVKFVIENENILNQLGINTNEIHDPEKVEVWGDKFSVIRGGTDRHISEALDKKVRSISFRDEDPKEFLEGYNIVVWNGRNKLEKGLLEFIRSRYEN